MRRESAKIDSRTFANPSRICEYSTQTRGTPCKLRTYPRRHSFTSPVRTPWCSAHAPVSVSWNDTSMEQAATEQA
eukprot:2215231-Prymnesium_polylepis.1